MLEGWMIGMLGNSARSIVNIQLAADNWQQAVNLNV
jgi:hypothetical protein